jgi:hypothetical protein
LILQKPWSGFPKRLSPELNPRGNVELYFKHRYKDFNYRIGSLTEYFQFPDFDQVWDDLRQMQPKGLAPVELDVLENNVISSKMPPLSG